MEDNTCEHRFWASSARSRFACAGATAADAQQPKRGGTLQFAISAETPHYDCHGSDTYATLHFAAPFYSTLLRFNLAEISRGGGRPRASPGRSRRT